MFQTSISYSLKKIFQTCMSGIYAEMLSTQIQLDLTKFVKCLQYKGLKNSIQSGNHGSADYYKTISSRVFTTLIMDRQ